MAKRKNETAPIYLIRTGHRLAPADEIDLLVIEGFKNGEPIEVTIKNKRNNERLRAYWKMLHEVVKATECAPTAEALHKLVKLKTGYIEPVKLGDIIIQVPASISFDKMTEPEMIDYFEHAKRFLAEAYGYVQEKAA